FPREVIVVDSESGDGTDVLVERFSRRVFPVRLVQTYNALAAKRNAGAAHASGDYLVFLDDDLRIADKDALDAVVSEAAGQEAPVCFRVSYPPDWVQRSNYYRFKQYAHDVTNQGPREIPPFRFVAMAFCTQASLRALSGVFRAVPHLWRRGSRVRVRAEADRRRAGLERACPGAALRAVRRPRGVPAQEDRRDGAGCLSVVLRELSGRSAALREGARVEAGRCADPPDSEGRMGRARRRGGLGNGTNTRMDAGSRAAARRIRRGLVRLLPRVEVPAVADRWSSSGS